MKRYNIVLSMILVYFLAAGSASAQSDPYGEIDLVYLDSVEAGPGKDVVMTVNVRNDEVLGSLSLPFFYDTALLTLQEISFEGSRAEYLATRIINPEDITTANGHFVVALIKTDEDPVAEGDGMMLTMRFTVSPDAVVGQVATIDTLFYPPGGKLLLVEWDSTTVLHPNFRAGKIMIGGPNRAPVFTTLGDQYVLEGDSLILGVRVNDPDGDNLILAATSKPTGANFHDNGDGSGQLVWVPDFVGPNSSSGTPFEVSFRATDGEYSVASRLQIQVINKNRPPTITVVDTAVVNAGHQLELSVNALDQDFESIEWSWTSSLAGAVFNSDQPGLLTWQSELTDTGSYFAKFIATDPHGFSDTAVVTIKLNAATLYAMRLDTVEVFPGEEVSYPISVDNLFPITGFNILFNYDIAALKLIDFTNVGTRSESFEYLDVSLNDNGVVGNVRLTGISDQGGGTPAMEPGQGPVLLFRLRLSGDLSYSGLSLPVWFRFEDPFTKNDNTMSDTLGEKIAQDQIVYQDGYIRATDIGDIKRGDINLNGLAAEIADVIYFTNYLIDPRKYPFNALQYANSDVNQDGAVATVSDLVALINWVIGVGVSRPAGVDTPEAAVATAPSGSGTTISYEANFEVGGVFASFSLPEGTQSAEVTGLSDDMTVVSVRDEDRLNVIVYSMEGDRLPAGFGDLFVVEGLTDLEIEKLDMSTADGRLVTPALNSTEALLPDEYSLDQNYPNPFNPETKISFGLPEAGEVRLVVYNILGREVRTLLDEYYPAGTHTLTWDATDDHGSAVASGVYFYRLETEATTLSRKMMLLK